MSTYEDQMRIGIVVHERLLDGDVTAPSEISKTYLPIVTQQLRKSFPELDDPHLVDAAVEDAILDYLQTPSHYDPSKRSLAGYLLMAARGDLLNSLPRKLPDGKTGGVVVIRLAEIVELDGTSAEYKTAGVVLKDDMNVEEQVLDKLSLVWERLHDLFPDPTDQELLMLMIDGIRNTNEYAEVLGIVELPAEKQERIVKQHKDRIKKQIQ